MKAPFVTCLCPTFRRPSRLLANSIACFEAQTYPADRRRLLILDDSGELPAQQGPNWGIVSRPDRIESLPAKYNAMVAMASEADVIVVWEDDDVFTPLAIGNHVMALGPEPFVFRNSWSHPSSAYSTYNSRNKPFIEPATGRFHSALAMVRSVAFWPETHRPDFDQMLLSELRKEHGPPGDPCRFSDPTYVFRWGSTDSYHGESFAKNGKDLDWYEKAGREIPTVERDGPIVPKFDDETLAIYAALGV